MKKILSLLSIAMVCLPMVKAETVETTVVEDDGISKKWELKLDVGGTTNFESEAPLAGHVRGEEALLFDLGVGYNFSSNLFTGIAIGYYPKLGFTKLVGSNNLLPVMADVVYRWNFAEKWSFFMEGRAGYLFSVKKDDVKQGSINKESFEYKGYTMFNVAPGLYYRLLKNIDVRFSLGYTFIVPRDHGVEPYDSHCENLFEAKLGMNFRKAPKMVVRTTPVEPVEEPVVEPVKEPEPAPVQIVETTTPEHKSLGEREVVIFYDIRLHNILPDKDELLQEMAEFVKTHKTSKIILKSYADKGTGNYKLNQMYSRNRMEEVRKHLIDKYGIPADQIDASYYGDTVQPFEENDKNRCSIITVKEIE